jgi:hypothetical protein
MRPAAIWIAIQDWRTQPERKEVKSRSLWDKKSGLIVVTLIATLNPVSQVLW